MKFINKVEKSGVKFCLQMSKKSSTFASFFEGGIKLSHLNKHIYRYDT